MRSIAIVFLWAIILQLLTSQHALASDDDEWKLPEHIYPDPPTPRFSPSPSRPSQRKEVSIKSLRREARSPFALKMPARAPVPFYFRTVNHPLTIFDYSLPPHLRLPTLPSQLASALDPKLLEIHQERMHGFHRKLLARARVPRPMELDLPNLASSPDADHTARATRAHEALSTNAWLLSGPQIAMLNSAQTKLRTLSLFELASEHDDYPENASLRSSLNRILRSPDEHIKTFPQALATALVAVEHQQREITPDDLEEYSRKQWKEVFPFLSDRKIDVGYFLLNH